MAVSARERNTGEESGVTATWLTARTLGPGRRRSSQGAFDLALATTAAPNRIHQFKFRRGICDRQNVQPPDRVGTGANLVGDRQDDSTSVTVGDLVETRNGPRNRIPLVVQCHWVRPSGPARIIVAQTPGGASAERFARNSSQMERGEAEYVITSTIPTPSPPTSHNVVCRSGHKLCSVSGSPVLSASERHMAGASPVPFPRRN